MARQMKDSGVEWIGMIPEGWKLLPLGNCFNERNEKVSDYDWEPLSVTKSGIVKQLETAAKSDAHDARKKVCKGDFVINSRSDRKQSCGISAYNGSVSLINIVLSSRLLNTEYVKFLLKNYGFAEEFYRWGTGIVADLWSTKYERMKKIMLPIPDKDEQQKIAEFLDEKVGEIDSVIAETKETIADYKKYKQTIITETVTKGLNLDVELKDTGNEWIGKIPAHWGKISLKNISTKPISYGVIKLFEPDENGVKILRCSDIKDGYIIEDSIRTITKELSDEYSRTILQSGDLVINVRGTLGGCAIIPENMNGYNIAREVALIAVDKEKYFSAYIMYCLLSKSFENFRDYSLSGCIYLGINMETLSKFVCPLPPLEEQKEIAAFLDEKCFEIDKLIIQKEELITDLESYKQSLIYEYVTGKKEVPEAAIIPFPAVIKCKDKRFAQAVLLTKILDEFESYHSGRVKVAKTLYVIENHIGFDFDTDVIRQIAGPLDEKYYKAEAIIRHKNWFSVLNQNRTTEYFAQKNKSQYLTYYDRYFKDYDVEIQRIIDIFKNLDMNDAELLATAYASWNDFIIKGIGFTQDDIVEDIFSWDDSKKRFSKEKWIEALDNLNKKQLSPVGHGKMTIRKS